MNEKTPFYVLIAPVGQLCGNGQLRETMSERRKRKGADVAFWYLSEDLVSKFNIPGNNVEAVVAEAKTAINWLQLRFGGEIIIRKFDREMLKNEAYDLPPEATIKDISNSSKS